MQLIAAQIAQGDSLELQGMHYLEQKTPAIPEIIPEIKTTEGKVKPICANDKIKLHTLNKVFDEREMNNFSQETLDIFTAHDK